MGLALKDRMNNAIGREDMPPCSFATIVGIGCGFDQWKIGDVVMRTADRVALVNLRSGAVWPSGVDHGGVLVDPLPTGSTFTLTK